METEGLNCFAYRQVCLCRQRPRASQPCVVGGRRRHARASIRFPPAPLPPTHPSARTCATNPKRRVNRLGGCSRPWLMAHKVWYHSILAAYTRPLLIGEAPKTQKHTCDATLRIYDAPESVARNAARRRCAAMSGEELRRRVDAQCAHRMRKLGVLYSSQQASTVSSYPTRVRSS